MCVLIVSLYLHLTYTTICESRVYHYKKLPLRYAIRHECNGNQIRSKSLKQNMPQAYNSDTKLVLYHRNSKY